MAEHKQTIYIALDDSGQLSKKEQISVYGGIIFLNKKELDKFINQYRSIVNDMKCKYCKNKKECNKKCPELKHFNLKPKDRRRFINYLKKYHLLTCIIDNSNIYTSILSNSKSKGRFLDYAVKMVIKNAVLNLIKENKINPYMDLEIIINIDEQNIKSNGYYNLEESIYKELKIGMTNIKNNNIFKPIIKGNLIVKLAFKNSAKCYIIQAADLVAGTTRKINLDFQNNLLKLNNKLNFLNYKIKLP